MQPHTPPPHRPPGSSGGGPGGSFRGPSIIQIILLFLLVWLGIRLFQVGSDTVPRAELTYSGFKSAVAADSISAVTLDGQTVRGRFNAPRPLPGGAEGDTVSHFVTTRPPVNDDALLYLLETHGVTITGERSEDGWWNTLLIVLLPWLLILGLFGFMAMRARGRMQGMMQSGLFNFGKSKAKRFEHERSTTTFDDVAGAHNAKKDMREITDYLRDPERFTALGAHIPRGILLVGPPGTGKTLLARATAGEAQAPFFSISGSEFIEMFVGVGASRVRDMFKRAKEEAPAVIFIDEIDSIGRTRGAGLGGGHDEREQTLNQILSEMDGFEENQTVIVLAATNRPDVLDPALTRPGRFDRHITLDLPRRDAREEILAIHTREIPLADDVDLGNLAGRTVGFSGADLRNLVNEAALVAGRRGHDTVTADDVAEARDKIMLGNPREEMLGDDEKRTVAYHESGHALLASLLPHADPLEKVSIIPRGRALGVTEQIPERDRHNVPRGYLVDRLTIMLGGRAAERLVFDDVTTGAADDLKRVTDLARRMVCQWGMSESLGPLNLDMGENHPFLGREMTRERRYSEHTAERIDEEIHKLVAGVEERAMELLGTHRDTLEELTGALLEQETLEGEALREILEGESAKA